MQCTFDVKMQKALDEHKQVAEQIKALHANRSS